MWIFVHMCQHEIQKGLCLLCSHWNALVSMIAPGSIAWQGLDRKDSCGLLAGQRPRVLWPHQKLDKPQKEEEEEERRMLKWKYIQEDVSIFCLYMYIYIHTYIYTYIYTNIYAYLNIHIYRYVRIYTNSMRFHSLKKVDEQTFQGFQSDRPEVTALAKMRGGTWMLWTWSLDVWIFWIWTKNGILECCRGTG